MSVQRARRANAKGRLIIKRQVVRPVRQRTAVVSSRANMGVLGRTVAKPNWATPAGVLALQRTVGNRAVSRLIQAKLRVGPVGDLYEQEADRVAAQVVAMPTSVGGQAQAGGVQRHQEAQVQAKPLAETITPLVQRQEEEELRTMSLQRQEEEEEELRTMPLQRQEEEEEELRTMPLQRQEEEELQAKSLLQRRADGGFETDDNFQNQLNSAQGGGKSLPVETRAEFEPKFGVDFSGVRIHTDAKSAQLNRAVNAKAFTHGQDIYMGSGAYAPDTMPGKRLLAHELTHTIQQGNASSRISRWGGPGNTTSHEEVTRDAFKGIGGYSKQAREFLISMSEQMDMRASFWATVAAGKGYSWLLTKFGTGMAFKGNAYDNLKGYWRKRSEAPNHGEAGMYKGDGASTDIARVNFLVDKAVQEWKDDNQRKALTTLGLALHSAEDRGAHGDGKPGTGHDPRRVIKPPRRAKLTQFYDPTWKGTDCDLKSKNPQGYVFGVQQAKLVLTKFRSALDRWERPELWNFAKPGKFKRGMRKMGLFFGRGIKKGLKY